MEVRVQGQELTIRLVKFNVSLVPDMVREMFGLSGVLILQFLVAGEGLHHANILIQWQGSFRLQALVPGHIWTHK